MDWNKVAYTGFIWRSTNIENFIEDLAKEADPNYEATQDRLASKHCLSLDGLSNYERRHIGEETAKKWHRYHA